MISARISKSSSCTLFTQPAVIDCCLSSSFKSGCKIQILWTLLLVLSYTSFFRYQLQFLKIAPFLLHHQKRKVPNWKNYQFNRLPELTYLITITSCQILPERNASCQICYGCVCRWEPCMRSTRHIWRSPGWEMKQRRVFTRTWIGSKPTQRLCVTGCSIDT